MAVNIPLASRIADFPRAPVSNLAPNAHAVLVICLLTATLFRRYALEKIFPKIPGLNFAQLTARNQKSFLNSVMHLILRLVALLSVIPAFIKILAGEANFTSTFTAGGPSFGTLLMASMIALCSIYIHEIIYREQMSFVTLVHHVGTVSIGAYSILFSMEWETEEGTQAYFVICCLFGFFDVVTEFWITLSFVICTVCKQNQRVRCIVCTCAAILQIMGSIAELPLVLLLFYSADLRKLWRVEFQVITPVLYLTFLVAQGFCVYQFVRMALGHRKLWKEESMRHNGHVELIATNSENTFAVNTPNDKEENTAVATQRTDSS
jgi:hypothetical protein